MVKNREAIMETIFDRIKKLADSRGKSIVDVEANLGLSKNYLYKWKKSAPNSKKLIEVADYFNVSTDYLLGRKEDSKTANNNEQIDLTGIGQKEAEEKIFSYEGKEIPKQDLELIRRILETGEYGE